MMSDYNHWLAQSEMWLADLSSYGVPESAINDIRNNAIMAIADIQDSLTREMRLSDRLAETVSLLVDGTDEWWSDKARQYLEEHAARSAK